MTCEKIRDLMGPYVDDEADPEVRREVETHVSVCCACAEELDDIRQLATSLAQSRPVSVPSELWSAIEERLDSGHAVRMSFISVFRSRSVLAIAASIVIVMGLGLFGVPWGRDQGQARAATVDFAILLDALQHDAVAGFEKFLAQYNARAATPHEAKRCAPKLSFELPRTLPGGFELQTVHILRFGEAPGVAARYDRGGEFLAVVFHAPVLKEHFGTHKDRACIVGKHRGHRVPVGDWSLVHLTDPTTCHCLLSRLDETTELPAVMAAVAPLSAATNGESNHHHGDGP
jgi:hypothetical protein